MPHNLGYKLGRIVTLIGITTYSRVTLLEKLEVPKSRDAVGNGGQQGSVFRVKLHRKDTQHIEINDYLGEGSGGEGRRRWTVQPKPLDSFMNKAGGAVRRAADVGDVRCIGE